MPRALWIVFLLALALRVGLVVVSHRVEHEGGLHPVLRSDSGDYYEYAELFAESADKLDQGKPHRDRLLPLVLGLIFRVTGPALVVAQLTNVVLALLSIVLCYVLACRWMSPRHATLAAGLWALNPSFVAQSCLVLTETLSGVFTLAALLLVVRPGTAPTLRQTLLSAGFLALAFWTRASAIMPAPALAVWFLLGGCGWVRRLAHAGCFTVAMASAWLLACVVSDYQFGVFAPSTQGYALWDHAAAKIMVQTGQAKNLDEAKSIRRQRLRESLPADAGLQAYCELNAADARALVKQHLGLQARNHLSALVATAFLPDRWSLPSLVGRRSAGGIWHSTGSFADKLTRVWTSWGPIALIFATLHGLLTVALWIGTVACLPLLRSATDRAAIMLFLLMIAAIIAGGALSVVAESRYRLPAAPLMAILTALAIDRHRARTPTSASAASGPVEPRVRGK